MAVEKVGLETIEWFQSQSDTLFQAMFIALPETLGCPLPLLFWLALGFNFTDR